MVTINIKGRSAEARIRGKKWSHQILIERNKAIGTPGPANRANGLGPSDVDRMALKEWGVRTIRSCPQDQAVQHKSNGPQARKVKPGRYSRKGSGRSNR